MKSDLHFFLRLVLLGLLITLFSTCSNDQDTKVLLSDKEYLPLSVGVFQVYEVTETEYISSPNGIMLQYEMKTEVMDSIPSSDGFYSFIIYRSTRTSPTDEWDYLDTWIATFNNREAIVQEGNISFVKLDLPVSMGSTWNGNLYNNLGEEAYEVSSFAQAATVNDLVFDDVVEVTQRNETDAITGNDIRKETYARGVGLISRVVETVAYCSNTPECLGEQIIEEGYVMEQKIKEYGKN